jgi:hypothetical protein
MGGSTAGGIRSGLRSTRRWVVRLVRAGAWTALTTINSASHKVIRRAVFWIGIRRPEKSRQRQYREG